MIQKEPTERTEEWSLVFYVCRMLALFGVCRAYVTHGVFIRSALEHLFFNIALYSSRGSLTKTHGIPADCLVSVEDPTSISLGRSLFELRALQPSANGH